MSARPIPTGEQAFSFSAASNSMSAVVLKYLLNNMTPKDFHAHVLNSVNGISLLPQDLDNLLWTLDKMGFVTRAAMAAAGNRDVRHCARCHLSYLEKDNGLQACVIQHDAPQLWKLTDEKHLTRGDPPYKTKYFCCNKLLDLGVILPEPHYVGRHTTVVEQISFNNINIMSCERRRCGLARSNTGTPAPSAASRPSTANSSRAQSEAPLRASVADTAMSS
ncbi:hypothetical protein B0H34DRAFT_654621 [Crassisporium funariophilum]|nr:hypothetical protein B0H34DRAFT_654621 [Crassisporium funariophilum]